MEEADLEKCVKYDNCNHRDKCDGKGDVFYLGKNTLCLEYLSIKKAKRLFMGGRE